MRVCVAASNHVLLLVRVCVCACVRASVCACGPMATCRARRLVSSLRAAVVAVGAAGERASAPASTRDAGRPSVTCTQTA